MWRTSIRTKTVVLAAALTAAGCDLFTSPKEKTTGTMHILNGVTSAGGAAVIASASPVSERPSNLLADGQWRVTPQQMTVTITGVSFAKSGTSPSDLSRNEVNVSGCSGTYDQTKASLIQVSECAFAVEVGTYASVTIAYGTTYQVLIADAAASIWSDPTAPTKLRSTLPAGGAALISVTDQNSTMATNYQTTYFPSPVAVSKENPPQLYVVFNPIHWMFSQANGGTPGVLTMGGNPPIIPALSNFGKAEFYSNLGSIQSFRASACAGNASACSSFLVLYSDVNTAQSVAHIDGDLQACNGTTGMPNVSFSQNGLSWGTFGMLGLDAGGVLTWAMPGAMTSSNTGIQGYRGLAQMTAVSTLGGSTTLTYMCTTSPPAPVGGALNYSSGHPTFTPTGSVSLTLLAR
ncbi:MAG: hypothetical protein AABZ80_00460 [Gemmatimonadota bacterium]